MDSMFESMIHNIGVHKEQKGQHTNKEQARADRLFNSIMPDIVRAFVVKIMKDCLCMNPEDETNCNIENEIIHMLQPNTKEILKQLNNIDNFDCSDSIYKIANKVIEELSKRGAVLYRAGIYQNPDGYGEEIIMSWITSNKELGEKYAKDIIEEQIQISENLSDMEKQKWHDRFFIEEI